MLLALAAIHKPGGDWASISSAPFWLAPSSAGGYSPRGSASRLVHTLPLARSKPSPFEMMGKKLAAGSPGGQLLSHHFILTIYPCTSTDTGRGILAAWTIMVIAAASHHSACTDAKAWTATGKTRLSRKTIPEMAKAPPTTSARSP